MAEYSLKRGLKGHYLVPGESGCRNEQKISFIELPDDVLFLVFERCDVQSLGRLSQTCKKMHVLLQSDSVWLLYSRKSFQIGTSDPKCLRNKITLKNQCRLSNNWVEKKYQEKVLFRNSTRLLPWMQYVDKKLWISTRNIIQCFEVRDRGRPREKQKHRLTLPTSHNSHDVIRFVVKENIAISGCSDGSLYVYDWADGQCLQALYQLHDKGTQAVDFQDTCIVSGSRDNTVKIISRENSSDSTGSPVRATFNMEERVWSLSISPGGSCFTVGTSGCRGVPSLSVWDMECARKIHQLGDYRYGAGVLDMKYETDNTLLSCGYDASLRLWDLRTGKCVSEWPEPYDYTLYCIQTDRNMAMVTGTAQHGMVRLWDKRNTKPVQEYFFSQKSPVYSVVFDTSQLFAALDLSINFFDFLL